LEEADITEAYGGLTNSVGIVGRNPVRVD